VETAATASAVNLSYLIETPETRGKFNIDAAVALGVPKGPM
jgi:hypothetical protein